MAKTTPESKNFAALAKKAVAALPEQLPDAADPITEFVLGYLMWRNTRAQADKAYEALMEGLVDLNELRVCQEHELLAKLPEGTPFGEQRLARMLEGMNAVYEREHDWQLVSVPDMNKRDQREYLDSLPGIMPYVAARVMLVCFGGHALPIDDKLLTLLLREKAVPEGLSCADAESWLLRQFKAGEGLAIHHGLQRWADARKDPADDPPISPNRIDTIAYDRTPAPAPEKPAKASGSKTKKKSTKSSK